MSVSLIEVTELGLDVGWVWVVSRDYGYFVGCIGLGLLWVWLQLHWISPAVIIIQSTKFY